MHWHSFPDTQCSDVLDRLDCSNLIIHRHDRNQAGINYHFRQSIKIDDPVFVNWSGCHYCAPFLHALRRRHCHAGMLYRADCQATSATREAAYNDVSSLRRAGSKHHAFRISIDRCRHLHSRQLNRRRRVLPEGVLPRVRIGWPSEPWQHRFQDPFIKWCCGLIIQVCVRRRHRELPFPAIASFGGHTTTGCSTCVPMACSRDLSLFLRCPGAYNFAAACTRLDTKKHAPPGHRSTQPRALRVADAARFALFFAPRCISRKSGRGDPFRSALVLRRERRPFGSIPVSGALPYPPPRRQDEVVGVRYRSCEATT